MVNVKQSSAKVMDMAVGYYMSHQLIPHEAPSAIPLLVRLPIWNLILNELLVTRCTITSNTLLAAITIADNVHWRLARIFFIATATNVWCFHLATLVAPPFIAHAYCRLVLCLV
jgi:hypothetical protein